jgi:hypothetical protein
MPEQDLEGPAVAAAGNSYDLGGELHLAKRRIRSRFAFWRIWHQPAARRATRGLV